MTENRKLLLIFSEADRLYWECQEKFAKPYAAQLQKYQSNINVAIIKNANHVFSFDEWQQEMAKISSDWLSENYSCPTNSASPVINV